MVKWSSPGCSNLMSDDIHAHMMDVPTPLLCIVNANPSVNNTESSAVYEGDNVQTTYFTLGRLGIKATYH